MDIGSILTLCEIIQFIIFMITILYLIRRQKVLHLSMEKEDTTVCDYR